MLKQRHFSLLFVCAFTFAIWQPNLLWKYVVTVPDILAQSTPTPDPTASPTPSPTPNDDAELDEKKDKVNELQAKLREIEGQKVSLSSTIQYINTRISLQQAEIDKTQAELNVLENQLSELSTRINGLEQSLEVLSQTLISRVNDTYKQAQTNPVQLLLISNGMTDFYTKYRYMQIAQAHTRDVMEQAESQKINFDLQKVIKAEKQEEVELKRTELEGQRNQLTTERQGQQQLLNDTKNDEAKYQAELQRTLAEIEAIQGIIAGYGNETQVREVKTGDNIASVIVGASPCSSGTHLHFEIVAGNSNQNPANYLKSISPVWNNSPDGSFSFNGDWEWPLNDAAKINQGYGMTYYARVRRAYGGAPHTGIDMMSTSGDTTVKSVKDGTLYRGGIKCGSGTLKYVRVIHPDGISAYYLHVNY